MCLVTQLCLTLCNPMYCSLPGSSPLSMGFSRQKYWSVLPCPPPGDLPNSGIKTRSPTFQADSLLSEPPGKPKNTGVDSLSLFQGNFPTQESNRDLRHCKWIPYQLSYSGSSYTCPIGIQTTSTCPSFVELIKGNSGLGYYKYLSY